MKEGEKTDMSGFVARGMLDLSPSFRTISKIPFELKWPTKRVAEDEDLFDVADFRYLL